MHAMIINWFVGFPRELAIFLISAIPITELRAALPLAYTVYAMSAFWSWLYAVAGTFFTMVIIVFALDPIARKNVPATSDRVSVLARPTTRHARLISTGASAGRRFSLLRKT